jgi:hypothetical protein
MSCPYFDPVAPRFAGSGPETAMLPLGDAWTGICRATPDQPWQPDHATLGPLCNLGYARGTCARFPQGDGPDAVRFAVSSDVSSDISSDQDATIHLYYVIERDHHPFAHGPLEHTSAGVQGAGPLLARQAQAYARSYLRRKRAGRGPERNTDAR